VMSSVPPPPRVSEDGRFYWDGERWQPMPVGEARSTRGETPQQPVHVGPPSERSTRPFGSSSSTWFPLRGSFGEAISLPTNSSWARVETPAQGGPDRDVLGGRPISLRSRSTRTERNQTTWQSPRMKFSYSPGCGQGR
jgi:hypothetical protein